MDVNLTAVAWLRDSCASASSTMPDRWTACLPSTTGGR